MKNQSTTAKTFYETQRFTQWWLWAILLGTAAFPLVGIYKQFFLNEPFGDNPMSDSGLIVFAISVFAVLALFLVMRLKTKINPHEIKLMFFPFVKKSIDWNDVKHATVVKYGFVGFGIRIGTKNGTVYNINGNKGLAIELNNGNKFLIGTQKEVDLESFLQQIDKLH